MGIVPYRDGILSLSRCREATACRQRQESTETAFGIEDTGGCPLIIDYPLYKPYRYRLDVWPQGFLVATDDLKHPAQQLSRGGQNYLLFISVHRCKF